MNKCLYYIKVIKITCDQITVNNQKTLEQKYFLAYPGCDCFLFLPYSLFALVFRENDEVCMEEW